MQGTDQFTRRIQEYLENLAKNDELFAETFKKEGKNIDDCITYILNTVQEIGKNGFDDAEIFNMAVHYYDETVEVGERPNVNVVINHKVELSAEEIQTAKDKAKQDAINEVYEAQKATMERKKRKAEIAKVESKNNQPTAQSLF